MLLKKKKDMFHNRKSTEIIPIKHILRDWIDDREGRRDLLKYVSFTYKKGVITLYSIRPGVVIGLGGKDIEELKQRFTDEIKGFKKVEIIEIRDYA